MFHVSALPNLLHMYRYICTDTVIQIGFSLQFIMKYYLSIYVHISEQIYAFTRSKAKGKI